MKERPTSFINPMVRAILENRKMQTRRIIKPQPYCPRSLVYCENGKFKFTPLYVGHEPEFRQCPHGAVGDRLWVKETFAFTEQAGFNISDSYAVYRADDPGWEAMEGWKWKPSIFMPRSASRITLEITGVSVERLQEISEADAIAEGCDEAHLEHTEDCNNDDCALAGGVYDCCGYLVSAKLKYKEIWESINGIGSWDANPYVWKIEFKRV